MSKFKKIEKFGNLYYADRYLKQHMANKERYTKDWYAALKFSLGYMFYRGRQDELSQRFEKAAIKTLDGYKLSKRFHREALNENLKANGVNNRHDRQMVSEFLELAFQLPQKNVVNYTIKRIKGGAIAEVYQRLNEIHAIGDKLAGLYLRDVVLIYGLESLLKPEDFIYCQPIDTWVRQVAAKLQIIKPDEKNNETIKEEIISRCLKAKVSPLLFNAGAWVVGSKSLDVLIEAYLQ